MKKVKLAHPVGHKLKYNGKYLAIGGKWYDLWGGNFDGFDVLDSRYYWIDEEYTTYGNNIETDIESSSAPSPGVKTFGYLNTYKRISIPSERLNDNFVMLEIPFNPYRETRIESLLENNMDYSYFKVGLIKRYSIPPVSPDDDSVDPLNSFSFIIDSVPTSVVAKGDDGFGMRYGAGSWNHRVRIPNISYRKTFAYDKGDLKIRLLCDLNTKKTYFKIASSFPDDVVLSDYIDTGFTMPVENLQHYLINVYAGGYGIKALDGRPREYLIAGYMAGSGTPITVKSYVGKL